MYANRYDRSSASRPISAGAALLINGALVTGLLFAAPDIIRAPDDDTLITRNIPDTPPPPPTEPVPPRTRAAERTQTVPLHQPDPRVLTPPSGPTLGTTRDPVAPTFDPPMGPGGAGTIVIEPPAPLPVLVDASVDPRFAANFQPDYPGSELRQEKEGVVRVRVLIGVDGRIKAVEQVASPSAGFFEATRRHALNKWRFKPATRDGIPVESWKVMTVRFRITR